MRQDLSRDKSKEFPAQKDVTALRVWHCKYKSLAALSEYKALETLVVLGFPDDNLGMLPPSIEYLSLTHIPKVTDLAPLAALKKLRVLILATLPSWDPSGKTTTIASLAPLATLPRLAHLEMYGVVPPDRSLRALEASKSLSTVRVSKYPKAEVARYQAATKMSDAYGPSPDQEGWD